MSKRRQSRLMLAPSPVARRTNSSLSSTAVTSFHGTMGLLSRPILDENRGVTHVSERAHPCPRSKHGERDGVRGLGGWC